MYSVLNSGDSPGPPQATSSTKVKSTKTKETNFKGVPNLKTIVVNCRKIEANRAAFLNLIDSTKPNIVIGTESWLTPDIQSSEIFPPGFNIYRKDRKIGTKEACNKQTGGGVFLMIDSKLISTEVPELDVDCEIIWAQVQLPRSKFLNVGSYYRPEYTDETYLDKLNDSISRISSNGSHIWLGGDFNLPDIDWKKSTTVTGGKNISKGNRLIDIAENHNLTQVQHFPTRGENNLDLLFTNHPSLVNRAEVIPGISDHDVPILDIKIKADINKKQPRKVYIYRKADYETMKQDTQTFVKDFVERTENKSIDDLYNELINKIQQLLDNHIPSKMTKKKPKTPWMSDRTKRLIKKRDKYYGKLKGNNKAKHKYKNYKQTIQKQIRQDYNKYINSIITENDQDIYNSQTRGNSMKKFYTFVKNLKRFYWSSTCKGKWHTYLRSYQESEYSQ